MIWMRVRVCVLYIFYIKDVPNPSACMSDVLFKNLKQYKKGNISNRRFCSYSKVAILVRLTDYSHSILRLHTVSLLPLVKYLNSNRLPFNKIAILVMRQAAISYSWKELSFGSNPHKIPPSRNIALVIANWKHCFSWIKVFFYNFCMEWSNCFFLLTM